MILSGRNAAGAFHDETGLLLGVSSFLHVSEAILLVFVLRATYTGTPFFFKNRATLSVRGYHTRQKEVSLFPSNQLFQFAKVEDGGWSIR